MKRRASTPKPKAATPSSATPNGDSPTVLTIIRKLRDHSIRGKDLAISDRQACVEHLTGEGYTRVEIAEILDVAERTITRDRRAIQEANALEPDPRFPSVMVGQLVNEADRCISHIRRAAREKQASPAVKVDAAHRCYQILSDLTQRLQQLGYLPTAAHRVEAQFTHQLDELHSYEDLELEVRRLRRVATGEADDVSLDHLIEIDQGISRAKMDNAVRKMGGTIHKEDSRDDAD